MITPTPPLLLRGQMDGEGVGRGVCPRGKDEGNEGIPGLTRGSGVQGWDDRDQLSLPPPTPSHPGRQAETEIRTT